VFLKLSEIHVSVVNVGFVTGFDLLPFCVPLNAMLGLHIHRSLLILLYSIVGLQNYVP